MSHAMQSSAALNSGHEQTQRAIACKVPPWYFLCPMCGNPRADAEREFHSQQRFTLTLGAAGCRLELSSSWIAAS